MVKETQIDFIGFHLNTICNYDCEYCYAKFNNSNWNSKTSEYTQEQLDHIINFFKEISPKEIRVLGGEPTISSNFHTFLNDILEHNPNQVIKIFTNLSKKSIWNLSILDITLFNPKKIEFNIDLSISFHPDYFLNNINNFYDFYNRQQNKKTIRNYSIDFLINESYKMVYQTPTLIKFINFLIDKNIKYRFEVIEDPSSNYNYKSRIKEIKNSLSGLPDPINIETEAELQDFLKYSKTSKICKMNQFDIDYSGNITRACDPSNYGNIFNDSIDSIKNNLSARQKLFCQKNTICPCYDLLMTNLLN